MFVLKTKINASLPLKHQCWYSFNDQVPFTGIMAMLTHCVYAHECFI